ncbi:photosystem II stability/assembly factor-like protein [Pseudomonas sp. BN414]|uniref:WD40/YVTN/BNR-like repeat-containing protein n=1 Tax=Pseudomonas TaxID=286 RepID=UPI0015C14284|nr:MULTISPECIES: YCF48-related protein [Pseudomonas]MDH4565611.1 photosystem II stability/assembly factor-like protein [Pseudomonas sp. BN414]NWL76036.1 photosystem II stability/assembly factor-like protein [Pseudomonas taiwanensis]
MNNNNNEGFDGSRRTLLLLGMGVGLQVLLAPTMASTTVAVVSAIMADPLRQPATMTHRAAHAVLTRVVLAGDRLVAMGERGLVVLSDDGGRQWRQARVPVSVTLTSASFVDAHQGWIAGHSGVVLHTTDGGESWALQTDGKALAQATLAQAQGLPEIDADRERLIADAQRLVDDGADKPLLSICFADALRGMVVGAFGLAATTDDGGKTWTPCRDRLANPMRMHLYAVARHDKTWVIAGEQGVLMRSNDDGASFESLAAPTERTLFAVTPTRNGGFVCAGLLGAACRIDRGSTTAAPIELPAPLTVLSGVELRDGRVALLAQGGRLLVSRDGGVHFTEQPLARREPLTSLAEAPDGGLVATSMGGVARLG